MKHPKRKQHLVFSALEGITGTPTPPFPTPDTRAPEENLPTPLRVDDPLKPDSGPADQQLQCISAFSTDLESPPAGESAETRCAPTLPGVVPVPLEVTPIVHPTCLSASECGTPEETMPLAPVPGLAQQEPLSQEVYAATAPTLLLHSGPLPHFSFVPVPPGTFFMGSPEKELGRGPDEVLHRVTLTVAFSMQVTPVTQALWLALMGANPSEFTQEGLDQPVHNVSWEECQEFIRRLNAIEGTRYRLPTEAEWEYACRAGTSTAFAGGGLTEHQGGIDPVLDSFGWYCGNSGGTPHPVAQKQPNAWGLYDMHGNVMEWCQDGYAPYGDIRMHKVNGEWATTTNERTDPVGLPQARTKVVRGGSWISPARQCRSASRLAWPAEGRSNFIGFRLVREQVQ